MYLSKKTYVKKWGHEKPEEAFNVTVQKGGVTYPNIKSERISYITEEIMYWRKANQIHGWFVEHGNEVTEDVMYRLDFEQIKELYDTCKKALDILNTAPKRTTQVVGGWKNGEEYMVDVEVYDNTDEIMELLPPVKGFFFGSYEIDDWYKSNLEETVKGLEEEINNQANEKWGAEYEYYASW